jgi:hypothetical protein
MWNLLERILLLLWPEASLAPLDGSAIPGLEEELSWLTRKEER